MSDTPLPDMASPDSHPPGVARRPAFGQGRRRRQRQGQGRGERQRRREHERERSRRRTGVTSRDHRLGALLVSPTLLVLAVVVLYPVLQALSSSLYGVQRLDPRTGFFEEAEPFVGLDNYTQIFGVRAAEFWNAFWNTTVLTAVTVSLETVIGVAMALIMHQVIKGRAMVRASILIPWAIPTAVSALLWRWIFNSDGVANVLLPGGQVLWTTEGPQAKAAVIIAEVWKTAPFVGLLVLAGLQLIPGDVYEAARVDGTHALHRFRYITLPLVKPALLVAVLFRTLDAMRMFDLPYILVGAQKQSVETLSMLAQAEASNVRFGSASAYAVILFSYVFLVALAFVRLLGTDLVGEIAAPAGKAGKARRVRVPVRHRKEATA